MGCKDDDRQATLSAPPSLVPKPPHTGTVIRPASCFLWVHFLCDTLIAGKQTVVPCWLCRRACSVRIFQSSLSCATPSPKFFPAQECGRRLRCVPLPRAFTCSRFLRCHGDCGLEASLSAAAPGANQQGHRVTQAG